MILVTGASGQLGTEVITFLIKNVPSDQIAALVRDEAKAETLKKKGVDIRLGNYDDPTTLQKAMQGINKVLLISGLDENRLQQHQNVVDAAKVAGVSFLGYTGVSLQGIDQSANAYMKSHFQTEDYIKASGIPYAFFRNTLYLDGIPLFAGEQVFENGIYLPAGDGKVPYALRSEMAEGIANRLVEEDQQSAIYEVTGADAYSFQDIATALSELSGKEIPYVNADPAEYEATLKQFGVPEYMIALVAGFAEDIKNGKHENAYPDLEKLLGRKPTGLKEGLKLIFKL